MPSKRVPLSPRPPERADLDSPEVQAYLSGEVAPSEKPTVADVPDVPVRPEIEEPLERGPEAEPEKTIYEKLCDFEGLDGPREVFSARLPFSMKRQIQYLNREHGIQVEKIAEFALRLLFDELEALSGKPIPEWQPEKARHFFEPK